MQISNFPLELDWRNVDVYNEIEKENLDAIRVIPFHELTMPLYNMHASNPKFQDCTHYCYLPQMWQTIWHEFQLAIEQLIEDKKIK